MTTAEVAQARDWATKLVRSESRGPGDTDNAMRRLARRYGLDYGALWGLRYRPPRRIFADTYNALAAAYTAECERQMRALEHELQVTKALAGDCHDSVVSAQALVDARSSEKA